MTAAHDPWGSDDAPLVAPDAVAPLPPRLADLAQLVASGKARELASGQGTGEMPRADELPEVRDLSRAGWVPLDASGYEVLALAAWPAAQRGWVADRRPRVVFRLWMDGRREIVPASGERADPHHEMRETAAACGLPPPPRGRLWMVRSPWPDLGVGVALRMIWMRLGPEDHESGPPAFLAAAREVLAMDSTQVWEAMPPDMRAAATAWLAHGRTGEDVADLVCRGLHPWHLERLRATGPEGVGLSDAEAADWVGIVGSAGVDTDTAVERVALWRELGVPGPDGDRRRSLFLEMDPVEARTWLEAGFDVDELDTWLGVDLATASAWRGAGFEARVARDLLLADSTLSPAEACEFDAAGIDTLVRHRWVAAGFSAAEARAWIDQDVVASEARVWRSLGLGPDDARAQRDSGVAGPLPSGWEGGWATIGPDREDVSFGVNDPPGTRGSVAAEHEAMRDFPDDEAFFGEPDPGPGADP